MDRRTFLAAGIGTLLGCRGLDVFAAARSRQVVLDIETTGLFAGSGDRIIEIACVELMDSVVSGRTFHRLVNPDIQVDAGATMVHGLDNSRLATAPRFNEIAADLLEFLGESELVIHNAGFDLGFLRSELARCGIPEAALEGRAVTDTLQIARRVFPGHRATLTALCDRFCLDASNSACSGLEGAMLDARLLADVYLALNRVDVGIV